MYLAGWIKVPLHVAVGALALTACGGGTERDDTGAIVAPDDDLDVFSLEVGDCFQDFDKRERVAEVAAVPCADQHLHEVFRKFDIAGGDEFPGLRAVEQEAADGCAEGFEAYVGAPYEQSIYGYGALWPSHRSWSQGDREIVCFLSVDEPTTGSARNSGITVASAANDEQALPATVPTSTTSAASESDAATTAATAAPRDVDIFAVTVGTCFQEPDQAGSVHEVTVVPCTGPHAREIYAAFDLADGEFPGDATVRAEAETRCIDEFESFIGAPADQSRYVPGTMRPTARTWAEGDREVLCYVRVAGGTTTGSAQGSGVTGDPADTGAARADVTAMPLEVVATGQCFQDPTDDSGLIEVVDCAEPHDNEMFAKFDVTFAEFPGQEAIEAHAEAGCRERFDPYVDREYDASDYYLLWVSPTEQTWSQGDREVLCVLFLDGEQMTGTAAGSGR